MGCAGFEEAFGAVDAVVGEDEGAGCAGDPGWGGSMSGFGEEGWGKVILLDFVDAAAGADLEVDH